MPIPSPLAVFRALFAKKPTFRQLFHDTVVPVVDRDESVLRAAYTAHRSLPVFLDALKKGERGATGFAVKIMLQHNEVREFVWITDLALDKDILVGRLASEVRMMPGYQKGQAMSAGMQDVFDWTYFDGVAVQGNFTDAAIKAQSNSGHSPASR